MQKSHFFSCMFYGGKYVLHYCSKIYPVCYLMVVISFYLVRLLQSLYSLSHHPMNFLTNFDWSAKSIAKVFGLFVAGVVALSLVVALVAFAFRLIVQPMGVGVSSMRNFGGGAPEAAMMAQSDMYAKTTSNILPPVPGQDTVSEDAESYEITDYSLSYRPHSKTHTCDAITALKSREEIVFEESRSDERSCYFRFRVKTKSVDEVLAILQDLNPDDTSKSVYSIQKTVEGLTDELKIQEEKLTQTEVALTDAQKSYDELTRLATRANDVESLTKLIDLKLNTINRLSQEKLAISQAIDQVKKNRADQLLRLEYTNFNINVYENRLADWKNLTDSWIVAVQQFVTDLNTLIQELTIGLVTWIVRAGLGFVYLMIAIGLARLAWIVGKRVWSVGK